MQKTQAILGSLIFLVIAPGVVAGLVPWSLTAWQIHPAFLGMTVLRVLGAALALAGLTVLLDSFARFALQGLGTPAPVLPPQRLVITGWYRYVRNPMYVAVTSLIVGQALLFGSSVLLVYAAAIAFAFFMFVKVYEEPTLSETFGAEYETYRANVPGWLPRLTPWTKSPAN